MEKFKTRSNRDGEHAVKLKPDEEYIKERNSLIPETWKIATKEARIQYGKSSSEEFRSLRSNLFHLWMDRLVHERIYGREWPR
jgi:hypothetical protein